MQHIDVPLRGEWIALNDLLKISGAADSGGSAKALVAAGLVKVDGDQESRKTRKIKVGQLIEVADMSIRVTSPGV